MDQQAGPVMTVRGLALLLVVAVPASSLAYGPTDEQVEAPRAAPSARLLPQAQAEATPAAPSLVERPPVYKSWAFWVGFGTLTAGAIAVIIAAVVLGQNTQPIPFGMPGGKPSCPTCI